MKASYFSRLNNQIRSHKSTFVVYVILRTLVILTLVRSVLRGDYQSVFYCALTLIMFFLPAFIQNNFGIVLPNTFEIFILFFIFAAEILGELNRFYIIVPHWDTMLHTINGFLCAAFGFCLVDVLTRNKHLKFELSPFYMAIVAFCFSMTIGVLWEFFEFFMDIFFLTDMQKDTVVQCISSVVLNPDGLNNAVIVKDISQTAVNGELLPIEGYLDIGLFDTMKDLIVNFIGATVFSAIGYFYVKTRGKGKFARHFIPQLAEKPQTCAESKAEKEKKAADGKE